MVASPLEIDDLDFGYGKSEFNHKEYLKYRETSRLIHSFTDQLGFVQSSKQPPPLPLTLPLPNRPSPTGGPPLDPPSTLLS